MLSCQHQFPNNFPSAKSTQTPTFLCEGKIISFMTPIYLFRMVRSFVMLEAEESTAELVWFKKERSCQLNTL